MKNVDIRLYGLIDPTVAKLRPLPDLVGEAVKGGATLIQYRDKTASERAFVEAARAIKGVLAGTNVPLLINDRIEAAVACEADGVHLGQTDMHPAEARAILGRSAMIGLTIKSAQQAEASASMPIDYICVGGVFATSSKDNPDPPIGLQGLREIVDISRRVMTRPIGAIAGIDASNAASVIAAGADGIAVISALFAVDDPCNAAKELRTIVDDSLLERRAHS